MKRKRNIYLSVGIVLLILSLILIFTRTPREMQEDFQLIASSEYDTVFLSMFPVDTYHEEDFTHYRAMTALKTSYCIPNLSVLEKYLEKIKDSGQDINTAYLGIRADLTDLHKLAEILSRQPDISFVIILSYPSAEYWRQLSPKNYEKVLERYCTFITMAPELLPEAVICFMGGEEWLIANPGNYESDFLTNEDISHTILLHSDSLHQYTITGETCADVAASLIKLTAKLREEPENFPNLSDHYVVFLGDSVTGNYTDSASIPGAFAGLTGAYVYNCGYGGGSATSQQGYPVSLPYIADALFSGDLSLLTEEDQAYRGIKTYRDDSPSDSDLSFIINYGLNDYFGGLPISSEDPFDEYTYCGAIRAAVNTLRTNCPKARIVLCTPNFVTAFQDGTEPHGSDGLVLEEYVNAVKSLADELHTELVDNYADLPITHENQEDYLLDTVHPNYACRFLMAKNLIDLYH